MSYTISYGRNPSHVTADRSCGKEGIMLKIRMQGTAQDIKWFTKMLKRDSRFITEKQVEAGL